MVTNSASLHVAVTLLLAFMVMQRLEFARATSFTDPSNSSSCFDIERNALLDLKNSLTDESNRLSSWTGVDCCRWHGIRCSRQTRHVVKLDLRNPVDYSFDFFDDTKHYESHKLRGQLSSSLRNLKHLTYLDLSMNNFSRNNIPHFIGSLINLQYLNLSYSSFTGKFPHHLGNLTSLECLDLSRDYIPSVEGKLLYADSLRWVSQLYSLKHLDLTYVDLSMAIDWFPAINMLPSLEVLTLAKCQLDYKDIPAHPKINFTSLASLDLSFNNLRCNVTTVPDWISNITGLLKLNLCQNCYVGPIPEYIETLRSLTFLDLSSNSFYALSPNTLSMLTNILHLDLSYNSFEGPVSAAIGNLTKLRYLNLYTNEFNGTLPPSFQNLSFLESLDICNNRFSGAIPPFIAKYSKLKRLNMCDNEMTGIISDNHFNNFTNLKYLDLSSNLGVIMNFSSTWNPPFQLVNLELSSCKLGPLFPQWLSNQRNLKVLDLSSASIVDTIPFWFSSLTINVTRLDLSENKLTGNSLLIHSNLEYLNVQDNLLSGLLVASNASGSLIGFDASNNILSNGFPIWLCNMNSIESISLSNNHLSGRLPTCLGRLENLQMLDLTNNSFYGSVPEFLGSLRYLVSLHLHNNNFEGHLPSSFQNLTRLLTLDVGKNAITGIIPPWIGETFLDLKALNLQANRFHGVIPQQLCQLSHLQILNLAHNNIIGSIPSCFNNLTSMIRDTTPYGYNFEERIFENFQAVERLYNAYDLISMDLSNNRIHGVIPAELMELFKLVKLNVSGNRIEGRIPYQIGNLRQLISLDLSRNNLSGPIPQSLSNLSFLEYLNVSFNDLSGNIPTGHQLQVLNDPSMYMGNRQLCGAPLNQCGGEHDISNHSHEKEPDNDDEDENVMIWFFSGMGPGMLVGFLGFCGALHFNKRWRYAYFCFFENVYDTLAVAIALKAARLRREFQKNRTQG